MKTLAQARLYGILDLGYAERSRLVETVEVMAAGGVDLLQLRAKGVSESDIEAMAREVHPATKRVGVPLIINDYPEIAAKVGVEGIHVGQDDASVDSVRKIVGEDCFIGKSTHSPQQARAAVEEGADYIGFGPIYATPTKPEYQPIGVEEIREVHRDVRIPIFCIGGIKKENVPKLVASGARNVVIVSGILQADDIVAYTAEVKSFLENV